LVKDDEQCCLLLKWVNAASEWCFKKKLHQIFLFGSLRPWEQWFFFPNL
jgi:hypothetical protein